MSELKREREEEGNEINPQKIQCTSSDDDVSSTDEERLDSSSSDSENEPDDKEKQKKCFRCGFNVYNLNNIVRVDFGDFDIKVCHLCIRPTDVIIEKLNKK